jgi:hypothetical protein
MMMVILLAIIAFPGITQMITSVYLNGTQSEIMIIANALAIQQMEIVLADKAGSGSGYGYDAITSAKYSSVNPPSPFNAFGRTVSVTAFNINGNAAYPAKQIVVRVTHSQIPDIVITSFVTDHPGL